MLTYTCLWKKLFKYIGPKTEKSEINFLNPQVVTNQFLHLLFSYIKR